MGELMDQEMGRRGFLRKALFGLGAGAAVAFAPQVVGAAVAGGAAGLAVVELADDSILEGVTIHNAMVKMTGKRGIIRNNQIIHDPPTDPIPAAIYVEEDVEQAVIDGTIFVGN